MGFYIDMINVQQGDSFLLTFDDPEMSSTGGVFYVLVDGGPRSAGTDLATHLKTIVSGDSIHWIIATHLDGDHIGGLLDVIKNFKVTKLFINTPGNLDNWLKARESLKIMGMKVESAKTLEENLSNTDDLIKIAQEKGVTIHNIFAGSSQSFGDVTMNILNPTPELVKAAWAEEILKEAAEGKVYEFAKRAPETTDSNNASVVFELVYQQKPYALFTAEAGAEIIRGVINNKAYTFLKIPHHGSKTGLDEALVKVINPYIAFLSVGDNPHGHPATEVLDWIKAVHCKTYCTNRTKYCRKECKFDGYGNVCLPIGKALRPGWSNVAPSKCLNNSS